MADLEKKPFWHRKTFMVITGASQGIGKNLAIEFSTQVDPGSTVLLMARSQSNLEGTKSKILEIVPSLNVKVQSVDLSKPDNKSFEQILSSAAEKKSYELYFLVHNAASIITEVPAADMSDLQTWNEYMTLNLYSVSVLTAAFLKLFKEGERCLLNLTSLAAIRPLKGLAFYCVAKAGREMYFKMLADEDPTLTIFQYAPGPIDTEMFRAVVDKCVNEETKEGFGKLVNTKTTVKMEDTVKKVTDILRKRAFQNGGRLDFYDTY